MAPLSLKVVQDEGAVTRTVMFDSSMRVDQALAIVKDKILTAHEDKVYGLFLTSADDEKSGIWLEAHRGLDYYMLRDGDQVHYMCRVRNLRVRMLDGSVKTMPVDESKTIAEMMVTICGRLGITNHDEYGLCYEGEDHDENKLAPGTGTLTLKRMTHQKEKDAKLQHLSKKLKTDDQVEWLEQNKTLREMGIDPGETLLLKRRLFYTDRNVDARDPVQLNLLYVQARDAVLEGRHPVTEDKAVEFAGIQCQIHFGDFQEDKHKTGFLENLHEYLPEQYAGSRSTEKKILKEYSKHQGLSQIDAKYLYTKTVRDLPTYGVTFFVVKEKQKNKKKLVPRLLGINAESILRLDEVTKEILQVWPLTQVKTYHAGKSETFTLNFGDYSDKEYSVKTNDAHRIRDILQGYIDIIRKRMEGKYNMDTTEHYAICEDNVQSSKGHIMEHISHNSSKVVEETFVGPSQIISYEPGKSMAQGTQIVTMQQIVVSAKGSQHQNVLRGEVPMRKDMSMEFVRKLNRLNSSSVNIVTLLTEPNENSVIEARKIVGTMETHMPSIIEGVKETAEKQTTEDGKKKLLDALQELSDCMKSLSQTIHSDNVNTEEAQEASKRIADLSTQMYFSLDPRTMKRSEFCRRSRKSFIVDDKMDATLRRASFIAAAQTVCSTVDNIKQQLGQDYQGAMLDAGDVEELEKAALNKMGKLNAAVAIYLTAYADPKNVDYSAAVTSMNAINELLPELAKDAKALSSVRDGKSRQKLLDEIRALCDAAKTVCLITDPEEHLKMQEAANDFGKISERLIFTFKRGAKPDKRNEIIELAREVGNKTSVLLIKANTLTSLAPSEPTAIDVDDAGSRCADAAKDLITCASLTAPAIHEPHCQSALTAAAEALSSSAQHLAVCWKPLVEDPTRREIGEELKDHTLDLAKALDRLKAAFAGLEDEPAKSSDRLRDARKLKFITTIGAARKKLDAADQELNKPAGPQLKEESPEELQRNLSQKIAQLIAALAALVAATSDRDNPDYATADVAISTITELMPEIVKNGKTLSASKDNDARASMLAELKAMCDTTRDICASSEEGNLENLNSSAAKFANSSGKLVYVFNPRTNNDKEREILDLSSTACEKASDLLGSVQMLAEKVDDQTAAKLDHAGSRMADAANAMLTSSQLTAPCMQDPRCHATMTSSAAAVSSASQHLASLWSPVVVKDPKLEALGNKLEMQRKALERELEKLKKACSYPFGDAPVDAKESIQTKQKLKFITSAAAANNVVQAAERELNKPVIAPKQQVSPDELRGKLAQSMAQLNAAIAALVAATNDRETPDYVAADQAMDTIQHLLPLVVKDTKTLSTLEDEGTKTAMLADLKTLCDATRGICASAGQGNTEDLNVSSSKFANAAGKLVYVFNPRANQDVEHQVLDISSSACEKASQLLNGVYQLAAEVGGDAGTDLDIYGSRVADAANALLTTAQLTSPCVDDPRCQATLLSSANTLSDANNNLASTWVPITLDPNYIAQGKDLEKHRKDLELELEKLKKACQIVAGTPDKRYSAGPMQQQRLQFVSTAGAAEKNLQTLQKELKKPIVPLKTDQMPSNLQNKLAQNLAELNAAIAALLAATSDRGTPDYDTAEQSVHVINQLMPHVVKDMKSLSATMDHDTRNAMLEELNGLCEATHGICASLHQGEYENLNDNAAKFANNSGKLYFVVSLKNNKTREQQIVELSSSACKKATQLLTGIHQLATEVGGDAGAELDVAGSKTADAAKTLLATAQLTSPCMDDPRCQATLLSSANTLSDANNNLASTWVPITLDPNYTAQGKDLEKHRKDLELELEKLKKACQISAGTHDKRYSAGPMQQQRLQFVSTAGAAEKNLQTLQKELKKPIVPLKTDQMPSNLQNKLAQNLAELNAAIAALLAATSDREKPDYDTAEQSVHVINQLMPHVVKDMKTLSATKDHDTRNAMLEELNGLCEATHGICASLHQGEYENLNDNAAKFANNSGKLYFVVSPKNNKTREQQIVELSSSACKKATQLLTGVHQLAAEVGGDAGAELDVAGSKTADAAKTLLATAQLTAPSMEDPRCQATLISSANILSNENMMLASTWVPLTLNPKYSALGKNLDKHRQELEKELEKLKKACQIVPGDNSVEAKRNSAGSMQQQRLQFTSSAAAAEKNMQAVQKELHKPIVALRSDQVPTNLQDQLAQSLAQLNAAIAALLAATADRENPDYDTAEQSVDVINQLMPQVVKDMKTLSAAKDADTRSAMLDQLNDLCEATHDLCASLHQGEYEDLNDHSAKFAHNSGKLFYVLSPKANKTQQQKIVDLSSSACEKTRQLLTGVHQLAAEVGGDAGAELDVAGSRTAGAAKTLMATAELTAPSMDDIRCQETLISAVKTLSTENKKLASTWNPITQDPKYNAIKADLEKNHQELGHEIDKLKRACQTAGGQRLQFLNATKAAKENLQAVQKEFNKPIVPLKSDQVPANLQNKLAQSLGQLNAAIASLLAATADREKPDYEIAEQSVEVINELMPSVVMDMKTLSATKDGDTRNAMLDDLKGLCEATRGICDSLHQDGYQDLKEYATKFANKTGKLYFVASPNTNQTQEHQIIDLSSLACKKATELLTGVYQLAAEVGGNAGAELDVAGARTADAAKTLLATAQLTAPSIREPQCQAAMVASANTLASSTRSLASIWMAAPALQRPDLQRQAVVLNGERRELEDAIGKLKAALIDDETVKSPTRRVAPPPPRRTTSREKFASEVQTSHHQQKRDFNQEFLDMMRQEESHNAHLALAQADTKKKADEEKALQQEFAKAVAAASQNIQKAETEIQKLFSTSGEVIPSLSVDQTLVAQKQMEQKLALAGASIAKLVAANHPDGLDRSVASKSTTTLSEVMPQMAQDVKLLRGAMNDTEREAFSSDVQSLFAATRALLQATADDKKKLNESAVEFGNKSAKLLYAVSTDVDPSQEKEIFSRTKEIGDSTTRLAVLGAGVAGQASAAAASRVCGAGGECAAAAGTAVYTAKLVAPSIQNAECQEALVKAFDDLSFKLQTYSTTWQELESQHEHKASIEEMKEESGRLEKLLEVLKEDLKKGRLVKRRVIERVVVEDTPLRQLACSILEDAKRRAELVTNQPEQRQRFAKYANELGQMIKQLDLTNHRCRESPHNVNKRQHLENAVQNLQVMVLQNRPSKDGKPQNNIVDLTEYVKAVAEDAKNLNKECNIDQSELHTVKDHCDKISTFASRVLNPDHYEKLGVEGATDDDIQEIGQFAQECEKRAIAINTIIYDLKDGKNKIQLQEKAARLTENINILRFATQSALSTAQSVSLDATLEDLTDLEHKIDEMLKPREDSNVLQKLAPWSESGRDRVVSASTRACAGAAEDLPPAYIAYVDHVRSTTDLHDDKNKEKAKKHLHNVLDLLKALTMTSSRHMATWQPRRHPETAAITHQILQELDKHQGQNETDGKKSVLREIDIHKLLVPTQTKLKLEQSQVVDKLQQTASKLSTTAGTIVLSANKPDSLARSLHAAIDSATQLQDLSNAVYCKDDVQSQKIDESTKEMCLQTYNVLKAADIVSQDPNNYATRRRLWDACRLLNDAINKLVRTSVPSNKLQKDCSEMTRGLQLQQSLLQSTLQPSCALHYAHCLDALQNQHDVIQKLNNEEPVSREEFSKTLSYVSSAVINSTEYAAQCAYLMTLSDQNKDVATAGFIDVSRIASLSEAMQDTCHRIMRLEPSMVQHEEPTLSKQVQDFQQAVSEAQEKTKDTKAKDELKDSSSKLESAIKALKAAVNEKTPNRAKITSSTIRVLDASKSIGHVIESASTIPEVREASAEAKARSDDIVKNTRNLNTKMLSLIREVKNSDDDQDPMTWVTYNTSRKAVLEMFEALLNSVRENGKRAGVLEPSQSDLEDELEQPRRSYVQVQLELANKWLKRPTAKADTKTAGEQAAMNIIQLGEKMSEDLKGTDKEEMELLVVESKNLLAQCSLKYDAQKTSQLMERLKSLRKAIDRGVVTMVVEDLLEGEEPLADLDVLADVEKDETKRKFLLEKKIAELLAHLGRVTKTARFVADAGSGGPKVNEDLIKCSEQTELLAPQLVKAAEKRVVSPEDRAAIEHYQKLLSQYADSLANVRDLCDQAVDPMDFVQTAGETMQRIREEKTHENDPRKTAYASQAITKLANRVINVSMSSNDARRDPELQKALIEVKEKLSAAVPKPNARPSRIPDWKVTTDAILRTTGEVESVLGGENIFKKQQTSDQPIFAAALDLHTAIRGWSAKDNEIVAVAKRMAVHMAKLSDYMNTDRKRELLATSKAIVSESHEVADLARKLAHECTDIRIKTNLLQVCDRIPTISGQLKMLATVKGSSLGHQGFKDDLEDMNTLVGNAQNLMSSVQEVVSAAASASVKIMSQRGGPRMKWVRKTNYY